MRDKKSNSGPSFTFMHLALVLLCAVLVTARSTGGLFASYKTADSDSDSARVAIFSFEDNLEAQSRILPATLSPGESVSSSITIKNEGEVALMYSIKIENLTNNLPIADQTIKSEVVAPGSENTFDWTLEWPKEDNSIDYVGKMDVFKVTVTVEQVD